MLESVLRLDERRVDAFIVRTQIQWLDLEDTDEEIRQVLLEAIPASLSLRATLTTFWAFLRSRIWVVRHLKGEAVRRSAHCGLCCLCRRACPRCECSSCSAKMEGNSRHRPGHRRVRQRPGMVTDMDIPEAIVGAIPAEGEPEEPGIIVRDDRTRLVDGMLRIDSLWNCLTLTRR